MDLCANGNSFILEGASHRIWSRFCSVVWLLFPLRGISNKFSKIMADANLIFVNGHYYSNYPTLNNLYNQLLLRDGDVLIPSLKWQSQAQQKSSEQQRRSWWSWSSNQMISAELSIHCLDVSFDEPSLHCSLVGTTFPGDEITLVIVVERSQE